MRKLLSHRLPGRRGAALTEYGIVLGLIAVLSIAAVLTTGKEARQIFCVSAATLASASGSDKDFGCDISAAGAGAGIVLPDGAEIVDDPVQVLASFEDVLFGRDDTGGRVLLATMPAPAAATFDLDVAITGRDAYAASRRVAACYRTAGSTVCSAKGEAASITVPAGVNQIGFRVDLPTDVTRHWENDVAIATGAEAGYLPGVWGIDASREEPIRAFASVFDLEDLTLEADVSAPQYVWADITGARNVDATLTNGGSSPNNFDSCYRLEVGGTPTCGSTSVTVPPEAVQLGYRVYLPEPTIGPDSVLKITMTLSADGFVHKVIDDVTVTRKNTPKVFRSSFDLEDLTLEADVTTPQYVWADVTGERNVNATLTNGGTSPNNFDSCYRLEVGGTPTCGGSTVTVPPEAVQVGYRVYLPVPTIGPDSVLKITMTLSATGFVHKVIDDVTVTRKNTPKVFRSTFDLEDLTLEADVTAPQYVWADVTGERNVNATLTNGGTSPNNFDSCYRLEVGGTPTCGASTVTVPPEAVQVGYKVYLPVPKIGSDSVLKITMTLSASGFVHKVIDDVTVTRKNTPAE